MTTQLTGTGPQVIAQGLYDSSSDQLHALGEKTHTNDGRTFRYVEAGGTALVSGSLYQSKVENTSDQNLAVAAASVGDTEITTTSTVTVDANEYAQGFVVVSVTPGLGKVYKIKSHPAASGAVVTLTLEDPIEVALTTSSRIDLVANPYKDVIINPTTATSAPVGVAVAPVVADEYGWLGVGGAQPVLADGALVVGTSLVASNGTAGAVEDVASTTQAVVGTALSGIADTEVGMAFLRLN